MELWLRLVVFAFFALMGAWFVFLDGYRYFTR